MARLRQGARAQQSAAREAVVNYSDNAVRLAERFLRDMALMQAGNAPETLLEEYIEIDCARALYAHMADFNRGDFRKTYPRSGSHRADVVERLDPGPDGVTPRRVLVIHYEDKTELQDRFGRRARDETKAFSQRLYSLEVETDEFGTRILYVWPPKPVRDPLA